MSNLASKLGQIGPKWDKASQSLIKMILKSPRFVTFGGQCDPIWMPNLTSLLYVCRVYKSTCNMKQTYKIIGLLTCTQFYTVQHDLLYSQCKQRGFTVLRCKLRGFTVLRCKQTGLTVLRCKLIGLHYFVVSWGGLQYFGISRQGLRYFVVSKDGIQYLGVSSEGLQYFVVRWEGLQYFGVSQYKGVYGWLSSANQQ